MDGEGLDALAGTAGQHIAQFLPRHEVKFSIVESVCTVDFGDFVALEDLRFDA